MPQQQRIAVVEMERTGPSVALCAPPAHRRGSRAAPAARARRGARLPRVRRAPRRRDHRRRRAPRVPAGGDARRGGDGPGPGRAAGRARRRQERGAAAARARPAGAAGRGVAAAHAHDAARAARSRATAGMALKPALAAVLARLPGVRVRFLTDAFGVVVRRRGFPGVEPVRDPVAVPAGASARRPGPRRGRGDPRAGRATGSSPRTADGAFAIGVFGVVSARKNLPVLLAALAGAPADDPVADVALVVGGRCEPDVREVLDHSPEATALAAGRATARRRPPAHRGRVRRGRRRGGRRRGAARQRRPERHRRRGGRPRRAGAGPRPGLGVEHGHRDRDRRGRAPSTTRPTSVPPWGASSPHADRDGRTAARRAQDRLGIDHFVTRSHRRRDVIASANWFQGSSPDR